MPHSLLDTNLQLLDGKLQSFHDASYFDQRVLRYADFLRAVIAKLRDPTLTLDPSVRVFVGQEVWRATEFIAGSTPRLQPFEIVYGLQRALAEWFAAQKVSGVKEPLIVTTVVQEPNFYFRSVPPTFATIVRDRLGTSIEFEIVQVLKLLRKLAGRHSITRIAGRFRRTVLAVRFKAHTNRISLARKRAR